MFQEQITYFLLHLLIVKDTDPFHIVASTIHRQCLLH
jgi:hypothetical protein